MAICISCQNTIESPVCPHCGYPVHSQNEPHQLPVGTLLRNRYQVGKVLGQGGFGITYLGRDTLMETTVAIKEFYPSGVVNRRSEMSTQVECLTEKMTGHYAQSKERFLREAKALAKFRSIPEVVDLLDFVEENNTAYIVMEYVRGVDLARYIQGRGGRLSVDETFRILRPVMEALAAVHKGDIVHRDISPDNIILDPMGGAKLLDFGAVRTVEAPELDKGLAKSTEAILKHGFAPIEQYNTRGSLGPWTDEYAMCATVWYCLTGTIPEEASIRVSEGTDPDWRSIPGLTEQQCAALEKGISVRARDRYPSMDALIEALFGAPAPAAVQPQIQLPPQIPPQQGVFAKTEAIGASGYAARPAAPVPPADPKPPVEKKKRKLWPVLAAVAAVLVVAILAGLLAPGLTGRKEPQISGREEHEEGRREEAPTTEPATGPSREEPDPLAGTYDVTLWLPGADAIGALTMQQIERFMVEHPGILIDVSIENVGEWDVGGMVLRDPYAAADIFVFSQDSLASLAAAGALQAPGDAVAQWISAENDTVSVAAASMDGTLWAYPMTSNNGYFMYYDTSIISPQEAESMEALIAACEAAGVYFRYELENGWYTASFFFATGCESQWAVDGSGNFVGVDDTFNSPQGMIAMRAMQRLARSQCYNSDANTFDRAGVVISGAWNEYAAAEHFGANLGVTDLPSFTEGDMSYHLGSFSGHRLLGIKPQEDERKAAVLSLLAQWLTGEECQLERYEYLQSYYGSDQSYLPSNRNAQASPAVQSNAVHAALLQQNGYAVPQGQTHGAWWDMAKTLGIEVRNVRSDKDLQAALDEYSANIHGLF